MHSTGYIILKSECRIEQTTGITFLDWYSISISISNKYFYHFNKVDTYSFVLNSTVKLGN